MKKTIAAGTIAILLAGGGLALAQQPAPREGQRANEAARPNAEDFAALTDARVAGLRAGLKLNAEQEKNWPAVEAALREVAKERTDRIAARRGARRGPDNAQQPRPDPLARLRQGADAMAGRAASLKKLADAAEPLYQSLDDGQKRRFGMLLRMGGRAGAPGHWQRRADNAR
jgi:zinc resistance-associated protein